MTSNQPFLAHYADFTPAQRIALVRLRHLFFAKDKTFEELIARFESHPMCPAEDRRFFLLAQDAQAWAASAESLVAGAEIFPRTFYHVATREPIPVWALASVCTHPEQQGNGYGRQVVQAVFDYTTKSGKVCAFQTDVPAFYDKLGCRAVNNPFTNSVKVEEERRRMWWCKAIMIHPPTALWPEGELDLNGPAY